MAPYGGLARGIHRIEMPSTPPSLTLTLTPHVSPSSPLTSHLSPSALSPHPHLWLVACDTIHCVEAVDQHRGASLHRLEDCIALGGVGGVRGLALLWRTDHQPCGDLTHRVGAQPDRDELHQLRSHLPGLQLGLGLGCRGSASGCSGPGCGGPGCGGPGCSGPGCSGPGASPCPYPSPPDRSRPAQSSRHAAHTPRGSPLRSSGRRPTAAAAGQPSCPAPS